MVWRISNAVSCRRIYAGSSLAQHLKRGEIVIAFNYTRKVVLQLSVCNRGSIKSPNIIAAMKSKSEKMYFKKDGLILAYFG